jgi:putative glycosyltransferase (TIGR04372 family)
MYRFLKKIKKISYLCLLIVIYPFVYLNHRTTNFKIGILSKKGRITQFTCYIEPEVRVNKECRYILLNPGRVPNSALSEIYGRYMTIYNHGDNLTYYIYFLIYKVLSYVKSSKAVDLGVYPQKQSDAWNKLNPVINFVNKDIEDGNNLLEKMGIKNYDYVCFGLRESSYYKTLDLSVNEEATDDYSHRNPDIVNYAQMTDYLIDNDYKVIKVGSVSGLSLPREFSSEVINYSKDYRTEFNDIYLHANARFIISGGSGNWCLGTIFNKPRVATDYYNLNARCLRGDDLFIPVKYWSHKLSRYLKFSEIINNYEKIKSKKMMLMEEIQIVHNTPDEISAVVSEMHLRLSKKWESTTEDCYLQRLFNEIFDAGNLNFNSINCPSRIGADFLRNNKDLLG